MSKPSVDIVIPVRNNMGHICDCLRNILSQSIEGFELSDVVVVDDASCDDTVRVIKEEFVDQIHIIELAENQGRAEARNIGAKFAQGDILLFLDSDCCFATENGLSGHVNKIIKGFDVSFGKVVVRSHGFWDRYMRMVMAARERKAQAGDFMVFVSANFAIKRTIFVDFGGFDSRYRHYGFEDRDFFARLIEGAVSSSYTPESQVFHNADFSLLSLCNRMIESGEYTSALFLQDHFTLYKKMSYSKFDVRLKKHLWLIGKIFKLVFPTILCPFSCLLKLRFVPFFIKVFILRVLSGLSYLHGTIMAQEKESF